MTRSLHEALKKALDLNDPEVARCFEERVGWLDGGCFCLAATLLEWTEHVACPVGIFRRDSDIMDHGLVALRLKHAGVVFIDGDGLSTRDELLHRWRTKEGLPGCTVRPVSSGRMIGAAESDAVVDRDRLLRHLKKRLGDCREWNIDMQLKPDVELCCP